MRRRLGLVAVLAVAAVGAVGLAPASARRSERPPRGTCWVRGREKTLDRLWHPNMAAAISYAQSRVGDIAFAVRTRGTFYGYRQDHQEWSASVLKSMMLVAYLDMPSVANHALTSYDTGLLDPMITISDNNAANQVDVIVGNSGLDALAARAGMHNFVAVSPIWGESLITPANMTWFFLHIDGYIVPRHRAYAMQLLASITPSQRWGIGEVAPNGWNLYFKGGWGSGTGLIDNQVALFTRGCARFSIAVLTMNDGSHDYGKATLREIFRRLLHGLPTGRRTRYR
jgi:beta-lactamase class A